MLPLERLVSDPAENIYVQPGGLLTLEEVPQAFLFSAQPDKTHW